MFQNNLQPHAHIKKVVGLAMSSLFTIMKRVLISSQDVLIFLFNVYVRPILEYGTQLFNVQQKKIAAYLERPQKLFTRMLYRRQHQFGIIPSYPARLKQYGMKSLHERRNIIDLQTGFEFAHVSTQNGSALQFKPSNHDTRFKKNYSSKEKIANKLRPSHFSTRTSSFMNQLKINISNFTQKKHFKQFLMNTEIDHYYS